MNTITPARSPWPSQMLRCLAGETPDASAPSWKMQGLFLSPTHDDDGVFSVYFSEVGSSDAWLAIPLGLCGQQPPSVPEAPAPGLLAKGAEAWRALPERTQDAARIHQEINQFGELLATSRIAMLDGWVWWLVPTGPFRWVGQLVHEYGQPPIEIVRDWEYQNRGKPDRTAYTMVSPSGWVVDLIEIIASLRASQGITCWAEIEKWLANRSFPTATVVWPSQGEVRAARQDHSESVPLSSVLTVPIKPAKRPPVRKPRRMRTWSRMRTWIGVGIAASIVGIAAYGTIDRTDLADLADPIDPADSSDLVPLEASEIAMEDATELALPTLDAIDGHSLADALAAIKPMDAPTLQVELPEGTGEGVDGGEEMEPAGSPEEGGETPVRLVEEHVSLDAWGTRREVRFGRGVSAKNGLCSVELKLEPEAPKKYVIQPAEPQTISGQGMCEWRIAVEDEDAELVVRVFSKPASRWLWMVQIGARINSTLEPVGIAPGEPTAILDRLRTHSRWLGESLDALQAGAPPRRMPGMPDAGSYSRWLRAQQRDTERTIRGWTTVAELSDLLTASGKLDLEFTIADPTRKP
ncbi:MAG: hypothetical protein ACK6DC_04240 [Planctomycetota bacterium]